MAPEEPPQGLLEELVERYRLGDAQAGEQLLRDQKLRQKVEILARQKTKDTPVSWQDAAQVVYIKIIVGVRRPKFSWLGVPQFYQWTEKSAISAINDLIRKEKRLRDGSFQEPSLDAPRAGEDTEGETLTLGDTIPDEKFSEAVKLAESVEEVGTAVEQIDRRYPEKGYLALWRGLVQEKDESELAAELGVKQPEISKRRRELSFRIAGELGLLTFEEVKQELQAIRQGRGEEQQRPDLKLEDTPEQRAAVKTIDQEEPGKNYLKLWEGLVQGKTQKRLETELGISQSQISKRKKKLLELIAGRKRSDTQW